MSNDVKEEKYTKEAKEKLIREVLIAIGENPNREGLQGTPERVVRMWNEIFGGYNIDNKPNITTFPNNLDGVTYNQMIVDDGYFYSHCEHHMLPFIGKYYFAYLPNPKGKVLGLSKVARMVDFCAAKLQIQERLVQNVVDELWSALQVPNDIGDKSDNNKDKAPLGMALVMEAEHLCKTMRGVKKKGKMRTIELRGAFKHDAATRAEFYNWVN